MSASPNDLAAPTVATPATGERRAGVLPHRIGHYELLRSLGSGGMSEVHLARDLRLGRKVALKFIVDDDRSGLERFAFEAQATAQLVHENIVSIYGLDWFEGRPFLVLEYVRGRTLDVWLREELGEGPDAPRLPVTRAVELVIPVLRALTAAHAQGLVHRDLKPSNIIVSDAGLVKVLDFGVAKRIGNSERGLETGDLPQVGGRGLETEAGRIVGTRAYMAPEQWRGEAVDGRTDLWAVGLLLFTLIERRHPLPAEQYAHVADPALELPKLAALRPDVEPLASVVDRCLAKDPAQRFQSATALLSALEEVIRPRPRALPHTPEPAPPFAGLAAFQEDDAPRFYGRETSVQRLLTRVLATPMTTLLGASGAGKSSLVRAGLIPALRRRAEPWRVVVMRPGPTPLDALAQALVRAGLADRDESQALRNTPGRLGALVRARAETERLLLFVDQLEELTTLASREDHAAFVTCLLGLVDDDADGPRVVLSLRQDFFDKVDGGFADFSELLAGGVFPVPPMSRAARREALTRPLEAAGYRFETEALVETMLDELEALSASLPLLQFSASLLWERRDQARRTLTRQAFDDFGGVQGALTQHASAVLSLMSTREQAHARALLLRLVTRERTRALVRRDALLADTPDPEREAALERLISARLLSAVKRGDAAWIELTHESLIRQWPTLRGWLDEADEDSHFLASLRTAAQQWLAKERVHGYLWQGEAAHEARAWLARHGLSRDRLGATERAYLSAVEALAAQTERRARRRRLVLAVAGAAVFVLISALAVGAAAAARRADQLRSIADESARVARDANRVSAVRALTDPTTALALLREVESTTPPRDWAEVTRGVLDQPIAQYVLTASSALYDASMSPDGRTVAAACRDGSVLVWSLDTPTAPRALRGHEGEPRSVVFSHDGERLISTGADGTLRVWSRRTGALLQTLRGHQGTVVGIAVSPDGHTLASGAKDGSVRLWDAETGTPGAVLRGHTDGIRSVTFSPDGHRLASAGLDQRVVLWDLRTSTVTFTTTLTDRGAHVSFSDDGERLLATEGKGVAIFATSGARLETHTIADRTLMAAYFVDEGRSVLVLVDGGDLVVRGLDGAPGPVFRGHTDVTNRLRFSPDRRYIISASRDRSVRVWRADFEPRRRRILGHEGSVYDALFSPDGGRVLTASGDGTVRLWSPRGAPGPVFRGIDGERPRHATWSPDGRSIAVGNLSGSIDLVESDGFAPAAHLVGHTQGVSSVSYSPDGRLLASASFDQSVRLWSVGSTTAARVLLGHAGHVLGVAFAPDGTRVASASTDGTLRLWDAATGRAAPPLTAPSAELYGLAFAPDGQSVVTGANDGRLRLWDLRTGAPRVLHDSKGAVEVDTGAFSPDGRRVVASLPGGRLVIVSLTAAHAPIYLSVFEGQSAVAGWSPDGRRLVVGGSDFSLTLLDVPAAPLGPHDPALWAAPRWCPSIAARQAVVDLEERQVRADDTRCRAELGWP